MTEPYLWGSHDRELARQEAESEAELAEYETNIDRYGEARADEIRIERSQATA
jgi:hypothetical protein